LAGNVKKILILADYDLIMSFRVTADLHIQAIAQSHIKDMFTFEAALL
jgi:hypothetical protein